MTLFLRRTSVVDRPNRCRRKFLNTRTLVSTAVVLGALSSAPVAAQDYPVKPVRIVVGFAAGSVSDSTARALALKLGPALGQPFVVEVRTGREVTSPLSTWSDRRKTDTRSSSQPHCKRAFRALRLSG